jgi:hypothetical protein
MKGTSDLFDFGADAGRNNRAMKKGRALKSPASSMLLRERGYRYRRNADTTDHLPLADSGK